MKEAYINKSFRSDSMDLINKANAIINEYNEQGYSLTLRQLYYQFVARDFLANTVKNYKRLGSVINDGRLAGLIDWNAIEDRTRNLHRITTWDTPEDIIDACSQQFRLNPWDGQSHYVEVWVEKEALSSVFQRTCDEWRIPLFACRGYVSQSEMWAAGNRLRWKALSKEVHILHFGDHDPSGIDMTRDIFERLSLFMNKDVEIKRMALNMDQIDQYDPPPNPAKDTDTRFISYREMYGNESWELDALEPSVLNELVRETIHEYIDWNAWEESYRQEESDKETLEKISDNFEAIRKIEF